MDTTRKEASLLPLLAKLKPSEQTLPFLDHYQHGCHDLVAINKTKGTILKRQYTDEVVSDNPKANIYYTLNRVRQDFNGTKPNKGDISGVHAWGADIDPDPDHKIEYTEEIFNAFGLGELIEHPDKNWLAQLAYILEEKVKPAVNGERGVPPTLVVFSGRGVQMLWYATKTYKATVKRTRHWEGLSRAIIATVGGDAVQNVDRLMRLPGTINSRKEVFSKVIVETQNFYSPDEIEAAFGPIPKEIKDLKGSVDPKEFDGIDWDTIFAINELLDLDEDLMERFLGDLKRNKDLLSIYEGKPLSRMADISGSGFDMHLVGQLRRHGYAPEEAFKIMMTYSYGSGHKHADNSSSRHFMRCWSRTPETSPQEDFSDVPTETIAETPPATIRGLQKAQKDIVDNYCYIATADKVVHVRTGTYFDKRGFDTKFASTHTGKKDAPPFAHMALVIAGRQADKITWDPKTDDRIVYKAGITSYNLYRRKPVEIVEYTEGCTSIFHKVLNHVIPSRESAEAFLDYCAFTLQHPDIKINFHPLLYSITEGVGKDSILEPLRFGVGSHNTSEVTLKELMGSFNGALKFKKLIILNEVESFTRGKEVTNLLKPLLAAPPESIQINSKYEPLLEQANVFAVPMTSNSATPLYISGVDRRIMSIHCIEEEMTEEMGNELWSWYKRDGLALLHHELMVRDISNFDPCVRPKSSEMQAAHAAMEEASKTSSEIVIEELVESREGVFSRDVVIRTELFEEMNMRHGVNTKTAELALEKIGAIKLTRKAVKHADGIARKHTFWIVRNRTEFCEKVNNRWRKKDNYSYHELYNIAKGVTDFDYLDEEDDIV